MTKKMSHHFFSIHAGLRAFDRTIGEIVLPWMSRQQIAVKSVIAGLPSDFSGRGPRFLRFISIFPPKDYVEIFADKITTAPKLTCMLT